MGQGGGVTLSVYTVFVVVAALSGTLLAPAVGQFAGQYATPDRQPLTVEDASVDSDVTLVRSRFGAGTYHFSRIDVALDGVVGNGTIVVQLGVPELNNYVLTRQRQVVVSQRGDERIEYQPSVELHPKRITREQYQARITVRLRTDEGTRIVAERTVRMEVRG